MSDRLGWILAIGLWLLALILSDYTDAWEPIALFAAILTVGVAWEKILNL